MPHLAKPAAQEPASHLDTTTGGASGLTWDVTPGDSESPGTVLAILIQGSVSILGILTGSIDGSQIRHLVHRPRPLRVPSSICSRNLKALSALRLQAQQPPYPPPFPAHISTKIESHLNPFW